MFYFNTLEVDFYVEQVESLKAEIAKLKTNLFEELQFFQKKLNEVRSESASKKELDCAKKGCSIHHDILLFTLLFYLSLIRRASIFSKRAKRGQERKCKEGGYGLSQERLFNSS